VVGLDEAGAGGGDSSGAQGVEGGRGEGRGMRPCSLSQGEGGGRGATTVESRGEGLIAGRVALYLSSFPCLAFMMKRLCLEKWYKAVGRGRRRALRLGRLKVASATYTICNQKPSE